MSESLIHNIFDMDFDLSNKAGTRIRTVFCKNKKFTYYTSSKYNNNPPLTFGEIFTISKPYFDKYVKQYEDYKIQGKKITNSAFRLSVCHSKEKNFIDCLNEKRLYEIEIDNKNKNKITFEYKNLNLIEKNKDPIVAFFVKIEVDVFDENNFFQYDGEKDQRIEDVCIICNKNKPNVLVTKCFHLVACSECFRLNNLNCCPYCHKPIAAIHKVVFAVSKRKN